MSKSGGNGEGLPAQPGRERQKRRTRKALLAAAAELIAAGRTPSVTEVADAADVSRRTAYRYFPTPDQLLVEAALEALRPGIVEAIEGKDSGGADDVEERLDRAIRALQRGAVSNEALLRTMIRLTVVAPAGGTAAGASPLRRGYRRIEWIELALSPVRAQLGTGRFERLVSALTACSGIDALIVLRDLRGLSEPDAEEVVRWTARTLLRETLAEAAGRQ